MNLHINNEQFKKTIVIFWAIWWLIALWTDIIGALAHFGMLQATWAPDTNYPFLAASLNMYAAPEWLVTTFFFGIIAWSFLATVAFTYAWFGMSRAKRTWMRRSQTAFIISLTFWLAFFLADQMVMKFDLEENHMVQGGFMFLTYIGMFLLPDRE